jgi:hypothetical protein
MVNELDPIVGNWYRHLDKGQMFKVVALDETTALVEFQHFDGDIEEVDLATWRGMDLEIAAAPEDWSGSVDVVERDDLGYSETGMSGQDWRESLQETRSDLTEAWQDTGSKEDDADRDQGKLTEELWEQGKIEAVESDDEISRG